VIVGALAFPPQGRHTCRPVFAVVGAKPCFARHSRAAQVRPLREIQAPTFQPALIQSRLKNGAPREEAGRDVRPTGKMW
jgi:hypothetical protein